MFKKISLLFSLTFLFLTVLNAQLGSDLIGSRDTIFVYDTLVIVDTIRISRSPIDFKDLEKLSSKELSYLEVKNAHSNEKLFIFSNGQTATLPDSNIKSINNNFNSKNSDEMKKIGFLGVVLFAFQNMVLAQNDVGIYLGSGTYNLLVADEENTNFVPTAHLGVSYQEPFANDKLFFDIRLNYSYLSATRFESIDSISISFAELPAFGSGGNVIIEEPMITTTIEEATTDYSCHVFSLPMTLGLNGGKFRPFIGIEPYLKEYNYFSKSINVSSNRLTGIGFSGPSFGASAILGFQIPFSERLSLNTSYVRQFTIEKRPDIQLSPNKDVQFQRLDLILRYRLFKKES